MAQSHEAELLRTVRAITRLQTQRRKLRRQLKQVDIDLRMERKNLKALADLKAHREPDVFPSRVFGDGVGHKIRHSGDEKPAPAPVDTSEVVDQLIGWFEPKEKKGG